MGLKSAVWVHGTIVQVEGISASGLQIRQARQGSGTTFVARDGVSCRFHIPIAAPIILDDIRPKLAKVFVLYETSGVEINEVDIFDASLLVQKFGPLSLSGQHKLGIDASNTFLMPNPLEIAFGLGISVSVKFPQYLDGSILFCAAGADFQSP